MTTDASARTTEVKGTSLPARRNGTMWVNPHSNAVLGDPGEATDPVLRHYFGNSVERALDFWGSLDDEVAALGEVREIVLRIVEKTDAVVQDVYVPESRSDVALTLSNVPATAAVWIHHGFVDHRAELSGSKASGSDGVWRTDLTTGFVASNAAQKVNSIRTETRPNCFILVPLSGECRQCDWRPGDDTSAQ